MTPEIAAIVKKIRDDLAWRGTQDPKRKLGNIVLSHQQATALLAYIDGGDHELPKV